MKKLSMIWFLMGLGSELQIIASLSMTEAYILIASIIMLPKEYREMRRTGITSLFWLSILVIFGGLISSFVHPTEWHFVLRKLSVVILVTSSIIVMHHYLRVSPGGFKWFLLGNAISLILCTFMFKQSVEVATMGDSSELIMSGPIYWIRRIRPFVMMPTSGWYLQTPLFVSIIAPIFMATFSMMTTTSGRSSALGALGCLLIVALGRKSTRTMRIMGKRFFALMGLAILLVLALNRLYGKLASSGALGDKAAAKYEHQTRGGTDVWHVLVGGRAEAIAPFYITAKEAPLLGIGLNPLDDGHRYAEFLKEFGSVEDFEQYRGSLEFNRLHGRDTFFLPGHSYMGGFWMTYGIFGLIFWIYVCFVLLRYLAKDAWAMPAWYGWLACGIPSLFWAIFFSPFAARVTVPMFLVACLLTRAVRFGRMQIPDFMIEEIRKHA